jgi:hypothetical protein
MRAKGSTMPVRDVVCVDCAVKLQRKTHWRKPRCLRCGELHRARNQAAELLRARDQARALRVVLHECGYDWESFESFRADLRESNLHAIDRLATKSSSYDRTLHERRSVRLDGHPRRAG